MNRMLFVLAVFGVALTRPTPVAEAAGSHDVVLTLDGGFAYVFAAAGGRVDLVSVKKVSGIPDHRLRFGIDDAKGYDKQATTLVPKKQFGKLMWDLTGFDAVILPGGTAATGGALVVPATAPPAACGKNIAAPQGAAANNLSYVADLAELEPGMTLNESAIAAQLAFTTGTLSIDSVGYCWQFEAGTTKKVPRPLARGIEGMSYRLANDAAFVDIGLAKRGTATIVKRIRLLPGADGSIRGRLSTAFATQANQDMVMPNSVDDHFRMFYSLVKAPLHPSTQQRFMPRFVVDVTPQSPGDDCMSVRLKRP